MKRESIIAIVLGVALGVGVGSVVLGNTNRSTDKPIETTTSELQGNLKSNRQTEKSVSFTITSPTSESTVSENSVKITGTGKAESLLVALSPNGNVIYKLEADTFTITMPLALGENVISLTYYPKDGGSDYQEKQLILYYLPE